MALGAEARGKNGSVLLRARLDSETQPRRWGGDEGCVGGACVWFAANELCGVPVAGAPSGLAGIEETGVSRAGTSRELGQLAALLLRHTLPCGGREQEVWRWLQFCSCLYFEFLLPNFKLLPHLQHALAAAFVVCIISQERSVNLSGLFPGSLSTLRSPLPAGWWCGCLWANSPCSRGIIHPVPREMHLLEAPQGCYRHPCMSVRGYFRCGPCCHCCVETSRCENQQ